MNAPPTLLSRVADHQYWMSRQIERAENLARLVRVSEEMLLDDETLGSGPAQEEYWTPVLRATAMESSFRALHPSPGRGDAARFLTLDPRNPDSILSCVRQARENARSVRDKISDEMWSELNALHMLVGSQEGIDLLARSPHAFYERVIGSSMMFDGITEATLARDEGWNFLRLGRLLERADMTSRFLDIRFGDDPDDARTSLRWGAILRACSAHASYRRLYGGEIAVANVVDLLVFSNEFPRSVRHCLRRADQVLHDISGTATGRYSNACEKITGALLARLSFSGPAEVMSRGLHEYIDELQVQLNAAGQAVFETYVLLPGEVDRRFGRLGSGDQASQWHREQQQQQQQ